jgi:hypothetical protein
MLEVQNNLMWLPIVTNVPSLLALRTTTRSSAPTGGGTSNSGPGGGSSGAGGTTPITPGGNATRRDPVVQVRSPNHDARFVGNTPLARLLRSRSVAQSITVAGSDPLTVVPNVVSFQNCVSWHARGQCLELCQRSGDHVPLQPEEAVAFHAWIDVAFA